MKMRQFILFFLVPLVSGFLAEPAAGQDDHLYKQFDYFGVAPAGGDPEIFAPGFASTHHHDDFYPMVAPDGSEVILRINGQCKGNPHSVLFLTHRNDEGLWSTPKPLPFLTGHRSGGAGFSPDGSRILFTSKRPVPGTDQTLARSSLWFATRTENGWSDANPLETPINDFNLNAGFCLANDGTMYAAFQGPGGESIDIFVLNCVGGQYPEYHRLPGNVNSPENEVAPFVNAEKGYLLYTAVAKNGLLIKLSIRDNAGDWTTSETVDELTAPEAKFVSVTPDGKYVWFVSHKQSEQGNPASHWPIGEFDDPPFEDAADIFWMKADFLNARVKAMKAQYGVLD